jgi:hypothetical protein
MDLEFVYTAPEWRAVTLSSREIFHFRHPLTLDGINGVSLLRWRADTIGIASVAQRAAAKLFKNGSFAPGVLETEQVLGDDVHKRIKDDWEELYSGVENAGRWPILEQGLKAKKLGAERKGIAAPRDAQARGRGDRAVHRRAAAAADVRRDELGLGHRAARPDVRHLLPDAMVRRVGAGGASGSSSRTRKTATTPSSTPARC